MFAEAVRKHWGIENSLHRCPDMTFREDLSRIRREHSAENMVVVRRMALNNLKSCPAKTSLAGKRRRRACGDAFFADVMNSVRASAAAAAECAVFCSASSLSSARSACLSARDKAFRPVQIAVTKRAARLAIDS